ncbi:UNVERIFIED_CONTAM: hypothetical protein GTU68_002702 [Idotea baltica]|nr:hypothetical protein [Idotea baltica]
MVIVRRLLGVAAEVMRITIRATNSAWNPVQNVCSPVVMFAISHLNPDLVQPIFSAIILILRSMTVRLLSMVDAAAMETII